VQSHREDRKKGKNAEKGAVSHVIDDKSPQDAAQQVGKPAIRGPRNTVRGIRVRSIRIWVMISPGLYRPHLSGRGGCFRTFFRKQPGGGTDAAPKLCPENEVFRTGMDAAAPPALQSLRLFRYPPMGGICSRRRAAQAKAFAQGARTAAVFERHAYAVFFTTRPLKGRLYSCRRGLIPRLLRRLKKY
jgi:hypothetical protein